MKPNRKHCQCNAVTALNPALTYRWGVRARNGSKQSDLVTAALGGSSASTPPLSTSAIAAPTRAGGAEVAVKLTARAQVTVEVLNIAGKVVRQVCLDQAAKPGVLTVIWDGRSQTGTPVPAGHYLVHVVARTTDGQQAQTIAPLAVSR